MNTSTLEFMPQLMEIQPNGTQIAHHATLGIKKAQMAMINPELIKSTIDDNSIATPVVVNISETQNINFIMIYGVYLEADPPAGISAGDYAPIDIELDNSGVFTSVKNIFVLGGKITALKYKKNSADTRKILVVRLISSTGI